MKATGAEDYAEDLDGRALRLRLIKDDLEEVPLPAPLDAINSGLQRFRYRQTGTSRGDSGAPVVEVREDGDEYVVGIHNAALKYVGQAVPMGPILRSILESGLDLGHKSEMVQYKWFPEEFVKG